MYVRWCRIIERYNEISLVHLSDSIIAIIGLTLL